MNSILPIEIEKLSKERELLEKLPHLFNSFKVFALSQGHETLPSQLDLPAPGVILFTSGSSGVPKGFYFSHDSLKEAALRSINFYQFDASDRFIGALPLHHMGGLLSLVRSLVLGAPFEFISPALIHEQLEKTKGNVISLVPAQLHRCMENSQSLKRLKEMKVIILGGEAPAPSLIKKALTQKLPLSVSYGATETGGQVVAHAPGSKLNLESYGFPMGNILIRPIGDQTLIEGPGLADALIMNGTVTPLPRQVLLNDKTELDIKVGLKVYGRSDQLFKSGGKFVDPFKVSMKLKDQFAFNECFIHPLKDESWGFVSVLFYEREEELNSSEIEKMKKCLERHEFPSHIFKLGPMANGIKRTKSEFEHLLKERGLI